MNKEVTEKERRIECSPSDKKGGKMGELIEIIEIKGIEYEEDGER